MTDPREPGQPPYSAPTPPPPGYQPNYGVPVDESGFEVLPQPPKRGSRAKLLASIGAVLVLGAGGAISYVAFSSGSSGGSSSPTNAVQAAISDLQNRDIVGLVDDLPPGERTALAEPFNSDVASLKRLGVLSSSADPSSVSGFTFAAHNLTYGKTIQVNDHVQIVQITGGSIDVSGDAAKLPFTSRFLSTAKVPDRTNAQHHDITSPIRIAVEKVGGGWYPSLFYTAADAAAHHAIPTASDQIPAVGADSPDSVVRQMISALMAGNFTSAIQLVSPDELGALHDYGGMLTAHAPASRQLPVTLSKIDFTDTPITDGVRVSLKSVDLSVQGQSVHASISGSCVTIDANALHKKICAADAANAITGFFGAFTCTGIQSFGGGSSSGGVATSPNACSGPKLTSAQKQAITDLITGLLSAGGVDTAQSGGQWYVTPVRSFGDLGASVLKALKGDDLYQLIGLSKGH